MTVGSCLRVGQAFFGAYVLCFILIFQAVIFFILWSAFFRSGSWPVSDGFSASEPGFLPSSFLFSLFSFPRLVSSYISKSYKRKSE